jgi:hypothetical protein
MSYSLGRFAPAHELGRLAEQFRVTHRVHELSRRWLYRRMDAAAAARLREEMLQPDLDVARARRPEDTGPQLLQALPPDSSDRSWVEQVQLALEGLADRRAIVHVLLCEWNETPDGSLLIAAENRSVAHFVRPGDTVTAGFAALRGGDGRLSVWPRIHRVACANGAVVLSSLVQSEEQTHATVAHAVRLCLSGLVAADIAQELRTAARTLLEDPVRVLVEARARTSWEEVAEQFREGHDRSAWGLINAVTAVAREERDAARRIDRERDVARILALLRRPQPVKAAARARDLPVTH